MFYGTELNWKQKGSGKILDTQWHKRYDNGSVIIVTVATRCNMLRYVATCCNMLQHVTTSCNQLMIIDVYNKCNETEPYMYYAVKCRLWFVQLWKMLKNFILTNNQPFNCAFFGLPNCKELIWYLSNWCISARLNCNWLIAIWFAVLILPYLESGWETIHQL